LTGWEIKSTLPETENRTEPKHLEYGYGNRWAAVVVVCEVLFLVKLHALIHKFLQVGPTKNQLKVET